MISPSPHPSPAPHSAGLRRDMEVLRELASEECLHRGGLGVVRIAQRLQREKSQVSRALRALEGEGLVERDPRTRSYHLGRGLYTLAARGVEARLVLAAHAHLHRLADEQRADVRLCVLIGGRVLTLISIPAGSTDRSDAPTDTPCGPVLTLDWSDAALRDLIPDGALHNNLIASTANARARGYVRFPETETETETETEREPASYAAAVRDFRGIVLAAIQLAERPGERRAPTDVPPEQAIVRAASALSADLGFEG